MTDDAGVERAAQATYALGDHLHAWDKASESVRTAYRLAVRHALSTTTPSPADDALREPDTSWWLKALDAALTSGATKDSSFGTCHGHGHVEYEPHYLTPLCEGWTPVTSGATKEDTPAAFLVRGEHPIMATEGFDPDRLYTQAELDAAQVSADTPEGEG